MSRLNLYRLNLGFYGLALGAWLGAMVMLAASAPVVFRTMCFYSTSFWASTSLDRPNEALAGAVVGNMLHGLAVIQCVCAVIVLVTAILQCTWFAGHLIGGVTGLRNVLRLVLLIGPMAILGVDRLVVTPRIWELREVMYDANRSEPERFAAREKFNFHHKLDERLVGFSAFLLLGALMISPFVLSSPKEASRG